jgi:transposase
LRKQLRRSQVLALFAKLPPTKVGLEACGAAPPLASRGPFTYGFPRPRE